MKLGVKNDYRKTQITRLRSAIAESQRFVTKAREAIDYMEAESVLSSSSKLASAKRASMDVTRAMADVRRSPWEDRR